ncbi:Sugar phosphate permease [Elusimicrobium minutum Pei191]|uniref:Sugar phosphate permease n=1 Tax=Elusimicrobium minutum (strain Pei191) TaxID=445932 RepID=B2KET1_ELUMP|nr:MFS transporter [Elusimicrobium minutum]ACC99027.1 Sugar phosphate permease [Elusimicrobium minutum Pei191]
MTPKKIFWLLFAINLFNYIDRQVLFAVFPLIKLDLSLTDAQLGSLASAFMLVYMIYAPLAGYFADRSPRQHWMGLSAVLWSIATFFTGFMNNFKQLLAARSFIGIGEAGFTTVAQGFLAEQYPHEKRARILASFGLALPAGSALGYFLGGVLGDHFGWRIAFMIVGVPGLLLGLLAAFKIKDARVFADKAEKPKLWAYVHLLKNKIFIFICLAQAFSTFIVGGLAAWLPTYFNRFYGYSVAKSSTIFGIMIVCSGALGVFLGGQVADRLIKKTQKAYFITAGASFALAMPFAVLGIMAPTFESSIFFLFFAIMFASAQTGPLSAAIVGYTSKKVRSMAFALNIFIIHALGDAISPMIIGKFSDIWNLRIAILFCLLMVVPACFFSAMAAIVSKKHKMNVEEPAKI